MGETAGWIAATRTVGPSGGSRSARLVSIHTTNVTPATVSQRRTSFGVGVGAFSSGGQHRSHNRSAPRPSEKFTRRMSALTPKMPNRLAGWISQGWLCSV